MLKRVLIAVLAVFFLASMLTHSFKIEPAQAGGTIYIRADGSVDPPSAPILNVGNIYYTFIVDINDEIMVERDSIVVDGGGHALEGTGAGNGISLSGRNNVTIINVNITRFNAAVSLQNSSGNRLFSSRFSNNFYGICLDHYSIGNSIMNNSITNNTSDGILLSDHSGNNTIFSNTITNNTYRGIWAYQYSGNNSIFGNNITNNEWGIWLYDSSTGNDIFSNTLANNYYDGIDLYYSSNCNRIFANNIINGDWGSGICIRDSKNNTILENNITNNNYNGDGIYLVEATNNNISANTILNSYWGCGISLRSSSDNIISANKLANNFWAGIYLYYSSNRNDIFGNSITNNIYAGLRLVDQANNNIVFANTLSNNYYGAFVYNASDNIFFHNSFTANTIQAYPQNHSNSWDTGYPSGGNYWSNYNGTDANLDGIGDTPYVIDASNQDRYPFMVQNGWKETKVAFSLSPNPAIVGQTVALHGNLTDRLGQPLNSTQVSVYVDGSFAANLYTNSSGWFKTSAPVNVPRAFTVNVTYAGSETYNPSSHTETLTVYQTMDTRVSFNLYPNQATVGQSVTLRGNLTTAFNNPIGNAPLELWVKKGAGSWQHMANLSTNSTGWFQASGQVTSSGTYQVAVVYRGTSQYHMSYKIEALIVNP